MTLLAHDRDYATAFLGRTLSETIKRRIGFQDSADDPVLIQRTMAEVSGAHPSTFRSPRTQLLAMPARAFDIDASA